jgi:phage shock protein PspC (stress-responsive transcriptional regulator)
MVSHIPQAGAEERQGVSAESLRDTQGGSPEPRGGLLFAYPSGSRPLEGYTIKRGVGRGGFGEVYYATSDAGKEVALKLVRRNLDVELRGMTQCLNLKHTNLISLYDIRQDGQEAYWIVMEYVAGESLEQVLSRHPDGLPPGEAVACMKQVCAGVAYLHDRGIVHRDLKPGNIFLDEGTYKIGDYGLSKFISHSRRSGQTESIGTVHYMAPEIANGRYGKEIDTYALGVMFYEMLTGQVPYEGESIGEVLMKHLTAEPDLARVPAPFRPIVARLLRKDPDQRYPSVPALVEDIDAALAGKPLVAVEGGTSRSAVPVPRSATNHTQAPQPRRLRASSKDQILSGVCAGIANYFGVDPIWIRLGLIMATIVTTGVPVLVYLVLAVIMPSDEEEDLAGGALHTSGIFIDPVTVRAVALDVVRVFVSLLFAVGVGCLVSGGAIMIFGWMTDWVYWIGPAAGLLTASLAIGISTRSGHPLIRAFAVLLFAGAVGMGTAVLALLMQLQEETAAFLGVGAGFQCAALGLAWNFHRLPHLSWRFAATLFSGLGCGLLAAGLVLALVAHTPWSDEMTTIIAVGAGFLTAAITAYVVFFGALSPSAERRRAAEALRATQLWAGEAGAGGAKSGGVPKGLVVAAVVLGLIPAALFVIRASVPHQAQYVPATVFGSFHACSVAGCTRPASVFFSKETYSGSGMFNRQDYCDAHARQSAWEALQSNARFGVFDINTGAKRPDFQQNDSVPE